MDRRSTDEIEQQLSNWERTRNSLGDNPPHGVIRYIDSEMDRLRFERSKRDRPQLGGRRSTDKTR